MITCTRLLKSDTGHRVYKHESKCAHIHGHEYNYEITAEGLLDSLGRIIDFSVIKDKVGGWIDENWDHNFLVFHEDKTVIEAIKMIDGNRDPFICMFNPTAENIAAHLIDFVCPLVLKGTGVTVTRVRVWETQNCFAEATLENK